MAERTHITFALTTSAVTILLIAAGMAAGKASAQQAPGADAQQMIRTSANLGERWETADCRTAAGEEVAPVSFDEMNAPQAWVIVDRDNGEPISAQRIDPSNTTLIRSIKCGGNDWLKPNGAPAGS